VIEGAAAVPVASLLFQPGRWQGKTIAVVLCGGNIDSIQFAAINGLTLRDR
jgi:threonine dehydratase